MRKNVKYFQLLWAKQNLVVSWIWPLSCGLKTPALNLWDGEGINTIFWVRNFEHRPAEVYYAKDGGADSWLCLALGQGTWCLGRQACWDLSERHLVGLG